MGFWRSLRQWWSWDGTPDTDPFRDRIAVPDDAASTDVSVHAHSAIDAEPTGPADENAS